MKGQELENRILMVGCGNMGEAVLKGIIDSSFIDREKIKFLEKDHSRMKYIRDTYGISAAGDKSSALAGSRYILMAVKPQDAGQVMKDIADALQRIEEGSFGVCGDCGQQIPKRRLDYIPYARLCVKCKSEEEKRNKDRMR